MAVGQLWTDAGQAQCVDLLDLNTRSGIATTYFGAWGSGGNTPLVTDTTLQLENPEARTAILAANISQPLSNTCRWTYSLTATAVRTVQETGVLTAVTGGTLINHIVHGSLSLVAGDIVTYTVDLVLKDSSE